MVSVIALKNYRRRSLGRLLTGGTKLRTALRLVSSSFFCASGTRTQILLASAANQCLLYPRKQTSGECSQMSAKCQEATSIAPNSCPRNERLSCGPGQSRTRRTRRTYRTLCEQFLWSAVAYQGRHPLYLRRFIHVPTEGTEQTKLQSRGHASPSIETYGPTSGARRLCRTVRHR